MHISCFLLEYFCLFFITKNGKRMVFFKNPIVYHSNITPVSCVCFGHSISYSMPKKIIWGELFNPSLGQKKMYFKLTLISSTKMFRGHHFCVSLIILGHHAYKEALKENIAGFMIILYHPLYYHSGRRFLWFIVCVCEFDIVYNSGKYDVSKNSLTI